MYKIHLLHFVFLVSPILLNAQLYTDASAMLPDNGAKGQSMDVRAADIDGDGDLDILLANEFQANTVLLNDGNANFTNGTFGNLPQENHDSEDVAIADYDGDGDLDLIFCSEDDVTLGWVQVHEYYVGNGDGSFYESEFHFPDSEANAVIQADISGDGFPDLFFGNNGGTGVFINAGAPPATNGSFFTEPDRVPQVNRTTQDLALADVDGDGDLDLFEGNENGNLLHINDGSGYFTDETLDRLPQGLNIETRKASFGDVDSDDDLDLFLSNVEFINGKDRQNRLFLNDGNGFFTDATATNLPVDDDLTIDGIFEDVDLDDDLDIVVCNVFGAPLKIYENDGTGNFINSTLDVLGQNYIRDALGVIAEDFNGDGFRDLYICDRKTPQSNNKDLLLLRTPVSASVEPSKNSQNLVYPNPVRGYFFIKSALVKLDTVSLYDLNGKKLLTLKTHQEGADIYRVNLKDQNLQAGIYFLESESFRKKIIIAN